MSVKPETAERYGISTLSQLLEKSPELSLGCTVEFIQREDCLPLLEKDYGAKFKDVKGLDAILYFLLNVPLLIVSFSKFGRWFFTKTALCIVSYSVFLALIPIPEKSIFEEMFAACFIGGILCGIGAGLPLTAGCSGGGEEILGLLCMQQKADFSVGRIAMLINVVVYSIGLFFFEQNIVVYSVIFGAVTYLTLDRMHLQNVTVTMLIITKSQDMEQLVFQYVGRGVTKWVGSGAYSKEPSDILLTVVSKKEAFALRKILKVYDPNVFVIMSEDTSVLGNFRKRLWA